MERHILVIDDDPDHRLLLEYSLTLADADLIPTGAASLEEAVALPNPETFACLVVDFNLGMVDAATSVPALRERFGDTAVVVVSSSEDQEVAIQSFRLGVHDFVPKSEAAHGRVLADHVCSAIAEHESTTRERRQAERRHIELQRAAETDALTGLPNRRLLERLSDDARFRDDRRRQLAVAMIDIDHFKSVNDTWGHHAGDDVLRRIASTIVEAAGPNAVVVRWGGEEIVAIKPEADPIQAHAWAERVRRSIRAWASRPDGAPVTASVGLAHGSRDRTLDHLIAGADRAVYLAKDHGRDCVRTEAMADAIELAHDASLAADTPRACLDTFFNLVGDHISEQQALQSREHAGRVERLCRQALAIAKLEGVHDQAVFDAAICHDLGKIAMPSSIFDNPGPLNHEELMLLESHAVIGARIASALGFDTETEALVEFHHHPLHAPTAYREPASLLAAADIATAMMEDRPYSKAQPAALVSIELKARAATRLDAGMADIVCEAIRPDGTSLESAA